MRWTLIPLLTLAIISIYGLPTAALPEVPSQEAVAAESDTALSGDDIYLRILDNRFSAYIQELAMTSGDRGGNALRTEVTLRYKNYRKTSKRVASKSIAKYKAPQDVRHLGYLVIKKKGKTHSLHKVDSGTLRPAMAPGEGELYAAIFKKDDVVTLKDFNHKVLGKARSEHSDSLQTDYKNHYFRTNGLLNIPAILIVIVSMLIALNIGNGPTPFVIGMIILSFVTMAFFAIIMKRPTIRGRELLDEMLGFKDFLEIAEKDELNLRNPPAKTPELFEMMLPYALALGVDQEWSERFAKVLAAIRNPDGSSYSPSWYNGKFNSSNLSKTTNGLTSGLSSAVGSSVSPPGSSSGGGGGGSSGGGGGGGGGGGW